ncbi:hypothetical protein B0T17DRAFT_504213 [Bombardia bombarda]|uniref:Uncharacterized protein n=1 Tax=Bombardia bombarda TaxID=252184 RepID=A0AA39XNE6_9PEZI|nr:hypothetical protein B0T17DRAFT_504213 [Bombardia bombarda]
MTELSRTQVGSKMWIPRAQSGVAYISGGCMPLCSNSDSHTTPSPLPSSSPPPAATATATNGGSDVGQHCPCGDIHLCPFAPTGSAALIHPCHRKGPSYPHTSSRPNL